METSFDFWTIGMDGVQAMVAEVGDTTEVFDTVVGAPKSKTLPGSNHEKYIPFGNDDQLPYEMKRLIDGDEVTAQCLNFNVTALYGAGVYTGEDDAQAEQWISRQALPMYVLDQATDMQLYYFAVSVVILSADGKQINRLVHKEAPYCRLAEADKFGKIPFVYYGNWHGSAPKPEEIEKIPLLDMRDPLGDLKVRMGLDVDPKTGRMRPPTRERKFAVVSRFPTAGCQYYPVPYWSSILRGGSYDEKRLISVGKRAKLRNHTSVKYLVEVQNDYYSRICQEEGLTDPEKIQERVRREKENIRKFLSGLENSDKVWVSKYYISPDGHEQRDIRINVIDGKKEGGEWAEDIQAAANTICFAFGVHPNMVGAVPGKAQTNNSGSDKRELYTMKQALLKPMKDILLTALRLCFAYNGFRGNPTLPMIQLTTLDEHRDAKITQS